MPVTVLPELEADGRARATALAALQTVDVEPVAVVEFTSHGRCLVVGPGSFKREQHSSQRSNELQLLSDQRHVSPHLPQKYA